jgi:hypothetical protein
MSDNIITIHVEWRVSRKPASKDASGVTSNMRDIWLEPYVNNTMNPVRKKLIELINVHGENTEFTGNNSTELEPNGAVNQFKANNNSVVLQYLLPMFLKVTSKTINVVPQLMKPLIQNKSKK